MRDYAVASVVVAAVLAAPSLPCASAISCAATPGSIVGWGKNSEGQAKPPAGNNYVAISAGGNHGLALRSDGSIVGWGDNYYGQTNTPTGTGYKAIAAGGAHSLAIKSDGSIVGWGLNKYGQASPPAGNNYVDIAADYNHSLALRSDGSIVGWSGYDPYGAATPPAGNNYLAISAIFTHCLALRSDGSIVGWGRDDQGQATPPAGNSYVDIAAGYDYSLALTTAGPPCVVSCSANVPSSAQAGRSVKFSASGTATNCSTSNINYRWTFGRREGTSTQRKPTHTYRKKGTYNWTLTASKAEANPCTHSGTIEISSSQACVPRLTASGPLEGYAGTPYSFVANATGCSGISYKWDFGDGETSTQARTTHAYSPGYYTWTVSATSSSGGVARKSGDVEIR